MGHDAFLNLGAIAALYMISSVLALLPGTRRADICRFFDKTIIPYFLSFSPPAALIWLLYTVSKIGAR